MAGGAERDSLVLIREGGARPPLFLVHDGDGETMLYRNLALRLDAGHAVYGLQPYALEGVPMAHTRIPEMAAYHIGKIRSVRPRGPYLLGGMCAGGVIAFEIARQLQAMGERVALLALLDAADPAAAPKAWRVAGQRLQRFGGVFREAGTASPVRRAAAILGKAFTKARNLATYVVRERSERARDEVRMRLFRARLDRGRRPWRALGHVPVRTAYLFAERDYRPDGRFDGELVLFRATEGIGPDEPYIERYDDPLLGWGRRATRGVRAIDVPGGHAGMLQEPHVEALAEQMQSYIDQVLADEPAAMRQPALA
jgi:thioesterase domain-containing protein